MLFRSMRISLFPFAGANTEATRSPTPMDLDEGSKREVDSPSLPDPPHSPNSPDYDLSSQEAALQATWWGAFQESMPARAWNPWPHCHFAWLDHMEVSKVTRPWAPSRLVIRDAQHFILQAEREKHNIMTLRETLAKSHLELELVILDLCSGDL